MKKLSAILGLLFVAAVPMTGDAAPIQPLPNDAPYNMHKPVTNKPPTVNTGGGSAGGQGPQPATTGTQHGTVKLVSVAKNGTIETLHVLIAGSARRVVIKGCGARAEDHPLLTWAFQERRTVKISTNSQGCFVRFSMTN